MCNQAANGGTGRDAVSMLNGNAVRHETTHGKAREEDTIEIDVILFGQSIQKRHQKAGVVDIASHQTGIPHGAVAFVQGLWHNHSPMKLICDLLEMELVIQARDVVTQSMKEKQDGHRFAVYRRCLDEILPLCALPFISLNLRKLVCRKRHQYA